MSPHPPRSRRALRLAVAAVACAGLSAGLVSAPAGAAPQTTTAGAAGEAAPKKATRLAEKLVKRSTAAGANRHLIALQRIADRNEGNRASNTPGYQASVDYVAGKLRGAGYTVTTPEFTYPEEVVDAATLRAGTSTFEALPLAFSPQTPVGGVTGPLRVVASDATPGCEASDFTGQDFTGAIALIARGGCTFDIKHRNAAAAGAVGAVISNNAAGPLGNVTLGAPGVIPTGGVSQADGAALVPLAGTAVTLDLRTHVEQRVSRNVIAQTTTGRDDNVVMAGAHLDSVPEGPGINDNGSGSAALLELALRLGGAPKVGNAVRFAWWGSEELGLIGSDAYVQSLGFEEQLDIALYLNFDMVASPNAGYFVYDGDNSDAVGAGAGPYGSAQIEKTFTDFLASRLGVPTEGTDFDGRSDYGAFIDNGIPAGGLFTGAEGIKSEAQAAKWGGTAGTAYDPCYHQACDDLGNVDRVALDRNLDAMAWAVGVYAYSTAEVNGVPPRAKRAENRAKSRSQLDDAEVSGQRAA
jgi:Zn-dependent M28 family amino/carboxypeptidase